MNAREAADQLHAIIQLGTADDLAQVPELLVVIADQVSHLWFERASAELAAPAC